MASPLAGPFRRDRFFQLGLLLVALVVGAAVLASLVAPAGPYQGDRATAYLLPPSWSHPLGTDTQGRDVLTRVVYGARISLAVGIISQVVASLLGVVVGSHLASTRDPSFLQKWFVILLVVVACYTATRSIIALT